MVGDYISTSFSGGRAGDGVRGRHQPHTGNQFDEAMHAPTTPLTVASAAQATHPATTAGAETGHGDGSRPRRRSGATEQGGSAARGARAHGPGWPAIAKAVIVSWPTT